MVRRTARLLQMHRYNLFLIPQIHLKTKMRATPSFLFCKKEAQTKHSEEVFVYANIKRIFNQSNLK